MKFLQLLILFTLGVACSQNDPLSVPKAEIPRQSQWVDSVYQTLSLDEKIGQLFMPMVFSKRDAAHFQETLDLIQKHHIGGVVFSLGGPVKQTQWLNAFQAASKTPLLVAMDAEWGVAMRLDSVMPFPWAMTLGAVKNPDVIRQLAQRMAKQKKRLGVHYSFGPVLDLNTNPDNPIIGNRSFGESSERVTARAMAWMQGHHDEGILTSGKHFPGHGDTAQDSHKTLPTISFSKSRIQDVELAPYKKLIKAGLSSVMVAHLNAPALTGDDTPTSLSKKVVTNLLKNDLDFKGLVVTDALNMKGALDFSGDINPDLAAFLAGHDILVISGNIPAGITAIKTAFRQGEITETRLAHSVKKILKAKYKVGLHNYKPVNEKNLYADLNTTQDALLYTKAMASAITLLKNEDNLLPLKNTEGVLHVALGDADGSAFSKQLNRYERIKTITAAALQTGSETTKGYDTLIVSFHRSNANPWKAARFNSKELQWIKQWARDKTIILDLFVKPYTLKQLESISGIDVVLMSYQNSVMSQELSADIMMGSQSVSGRLPVSASKTYTLGAGMDLKGGYRMGYSRPVTLGFDPGKLEQVDALIQTAIDSMMTPGAQLLVARKGKIAIQKSYGFHTYKKKKPVSNNDLYDLASLTKVLATLPMVMQAVDRGDFELNSPLSQWMPEWKSTNKAGFTLKQMLSHYARLTPWIPFYQSTLDKRNLPRNKFYRPKQTDRFNIPVSGRLYLKSDYETNLYKEIADSPLLDTLEYRYSDLPYYILKKYFEQQQDSPFELQVSDSLFMPLGLKHMTFNAHKHAALTVVPSEEDRYFRYATLKGYVHDMGAAMQGGVGGHAGLFSNAFDVAVIMQMYLQGGVYGGLRFVESKTLDAFNTCYYCPFGNRRGVGFDKPQLKGSGSTCGCVSKSSFGHMGFTGTYAWADPEKEIVMVFLSNRTYPKMENNLLGKHNIRTRLQQLVYDALTD